MRLLSLVGAPAILFAIRDWCGGRRFTIHVFRVIWGMPANSSHWMYHSMNINWLNTSEAAASFDTEYVTRVLNQFDNTIITNFNGTRVRSGHCNRICI